MAAKKEEHVNTVKTMIAMGVVAVLSCAALANTPLPAGSGLYDTTLAGGPLHPAYDTVFPSGLTKLYSVTEAITATKSTLTAVMSGTVTSTVWKNASNQLTFEYQFNEQGTSEIETASFDSTPWVGVTISDAGADGTGHSCPDSGSPYTWTNGDPATISRNAGTFAPYISWSQTPYGTYLIGGANTGLSANIWFSTTDTGWAWSDTSLQDSSATGEVVLLAPGSTPAIDPPSPSVPEPLTMAGVLLGVGALGRYWSGKHPVVA
jgi:hypothetical protein